MLTSVILIIIAAILVGVYVSWRAGRLDRLHARVEAARAALDAALVRRDHVHDHAALEHVGHAALDAGGPGYRSAPGLALRGLGVLGPGTSCGTGD